MPSPPTKTYIWRENGFLIFISSSLIHGSPSLPFPPPFCTSLYQIPVFLSKYLCFLPTNLATFPLTLAVLSPLLSFLSPSLGAHLSFSVPHISDNVIFQLLSPERQCHSTFNACSPLVL